MAKDINGVEIPAFNPNSVNDQVASLEKFQQTMAPSAIATSDGQMLESTDANEISLAALSNGHSVNPDERFTVKSYDGSIGEVTGVNLQKVLASGDYILETKAERALREDEKKYGENNVEAAALGAARGLSFGGSDVFLKEGGFYTGDELRGTENANKVASIGGEIGGAILPALLTGGSSAAAQGAGKFLGAGIRASEALGSKAAAAVALRTEGLAARQASLGAKALTEAAEAAATGSTTLSAKGAEAATGLMAKSLEKGGYAAKQAQNIANKMLYGGLEHMAPEAANLAVQGALQGAGRLVTEDVFGTAEFNAENLLAYAGVGALVGGTFGAAIGGGKALVPKAAEFISPVTGKIKAKAGEFVDSVLGKESAAMNLVDLTPAALAKARAKSPDFDALITNEVEDIIAKKAPKTAEDFDKAVISTHKETGQEIGAIYKETDDIIAKNVAADEATKVVGADSAALTSNITKAVDAHLEKLGIAVTKKEREALFNVADDFVSQVSKDLEAEAVTASKLQEYAESLQKKIYTKGSIATEAEASNKLVLKEILNVIRAEQRALVKRASLLEGGAGLKGSLTDRLMKANKSFSVLNEVVYNSKKSLAKEALSGGFDVAIDAKDAVAFLADPYAGGAFKAARMALNSFTVQKQLAMGALETSQRKFTQSVSTGIRGLATGTKTLAKATEPSIVRSLVSSELAVRNEDGKKMKPRTEAEAYNNIIDNANKAVTDPEAVLQHSNRQTAALYEHAPNTAAAIDVKYLQVMQFIASKNKKSNKNTGLFDYRPKAPSGFETAKMARYLDAIANPQSMVDKVAKGKLSREHVEVMQSIFPEMHNQLKASVLDFVAKNKEKGPKLTYQQQLQLGQLIGVQAHESTSPENVQALQSMFGEQPVSEEPGSQFTPARADSVEKSESIGGGVYDSVTGE